MRLLDRLKMSTNILRKFKTFLRIRKENKLGFKKSWNLFKVYSSLYLKSPKVWGRPYMLLIEPTNLCNLRCPVCPTGGSKCKRAKGYINFELYKKIIDELKDYLLSVYLTNYGEPMLNPKIIDMIQYAHAQGIKTNIATNGHFFNERAVRDIINSGLDDLSIALDGCDQKTLERYRVGANFDKIVEGINLVTKIKKEMNVKHPIVTLQFIVMKHNEHQIEQIRELARELGVNKLAFKTVWVGDSVEANNLLPTNKKYLRPIFRDKDVRFDNFCIRLWTESVINWDGKVVPCCYDFYEDCVMGDVQQEKFSNIWNNEKYISFRRSILKNKKKISLCATCPVNLDLSFEEKIR